jgi:hypothetical protein
MRMRERVLNRGIPAPRATLLLQFSQKQKCRSMFFLRFGGCRHVALIAVEKTEIEGTHTIHTKHTAGDNRGRKTSGYVAYRVRCMRGTAARCRCGWPRTTTRLPRRVRGATGARRGPEDRRLRSPWRCRCAPPCATASVETTRDRKTHTIPTTITSGAHGMEKALYSARKGENVFPTAHERQNAYHRYHAYQPVVESVRLGGEETRSDPYHGSICGKQTFGPCVGMIGSALTATCSRNLRRV